jgi:hypothetical protein
VELALPEKSPLGADATPDSFWQIDFIPLLNTLIRNEKEQLTGQNTPFPFVFALSRLLTFLPYRDANH